MTDDADRARWLGSLFKDWPTWLLIGLFLVLAGAFGLAGVLDDWLRALLAVTFVGIAVALWIRFRNGLGTGQDQTASVGQTTDVHRPPEPVPDDAG